MQPPKTVVRPGTGEEIGDLTVVVAADAAPNKQAKPEKKAKSGQKATRGKSSKAEKQEESDTSGKNDKSGKDDKAVKKDKPGKKDKSGKKDKTGKKDKASKKDKTSKKAKQGKNDEPDTPEVAEGEKKPAAETMASPEQPSAKSAKLSKPARASTQSSESLAVPTLGKTGKASAKKQVKPAVTATKKSSVEAGAGDKKHTVRAASLLSDQGDDAHGFARLIRAMPGIVALVEQHETPVHRAVFDSYVTAVVEFGVDAADLAPIDIRTSAPDALTAAEPAPGAGRSGSARASGSSAGSVRAGRTRRPSGINSAQPEVPQSPDAATGQKSAGSPTAAKPEQVRSPRSSVRASTRTGAGQARASAAKVATESAATTRAGTTPIASRTRAGARSGAGGRSRAAAQAKSLEELAAELKPTNNGQRIALAIASILRSDGEVSAASISSEFERMTWRVPVNVAASVRQAARAGLVDLEGPTGTRLTAAGERYVAGS
ncbi:MAG: hypothetical protein ACTIA6_08350 [Pseudoclavibacter sp.]